MGLHTGKPGLALCGILRSHFFLLSELGSAGPNTGSHGPLGLSRGTRHPGADTVPEVMQHLFPEELEKEAGF